MNYTELTAERDSEGNIIYNEDGQSNMIVVQQVEITLTIADIHNNWQAYFKDYKQAREFLKTFADGRELTPAEVKILAQWFVLPSTAILALLTEQEYDDASRYFNTQSIASRRARYDEFKRWARKKLGIALAQALLYYIVSGRYDDQYIEYGLEGTMKINFEGDPDPYGLFDLLLGMEGVSDELKAEAMEILDHGNF